nr:hypothetical protein [Mycoplasmopsis bovis]
MLIKKRTNGQIELGNHLQKQYFKNNTEYQNVYTPDNKTSVISFKTFEEDSASHIEKSLKEAKEKSVKNIVFNLTLNGGGFIGADFWNNGFPWLISHLSRTLITLYQARKK